MTEVAREGMKEERQQHTRIIATSLSNNRRVALLVSRVCEIRFMATMRPYVPNTKERE